MKIFFISSSSSSELIALILVELLVLVNEIITAYQCLTTLIA